MPKLDWYSRKGQSRYQNCDGCGVVTSEKYLFAVIADAAESNGSKPSDYIAAWTRHLIDALAASHELNQEIVVNTMRDAHSQVRMKYLKEKACYSALLIDHTKLTAYAFSCGDCRVGRRAGDGNIEWVTPVHSNANWSGEAFTQAHVLLPDRHIVTRTLNAKRFMEPDIVVVEHSDEISWILATDGYWIEHQMQAVPAHEVHDDASSLSICTLKDGAETDSDCTNWYFGS